MKGLHERIAWAIENIKKMDRDVTDDELSKKLLTNKNTIGSYRKKRGLIKGIVLEKLASEYGFNEEWLLSGKGEPYPGAYRKFPELVLDAPEGESRENTFIQGARYPYLQLGNLDFKNVKTADVIQMAVNILESRTSYAQILFLNIQQFFSAMQSERLINQTEEEHGKLRSALEATRKEMLGLEEKLGAELDRQIKSLYSQIETLQKENEILKKPKKKKIS